MVEWDAPFEGRDLEQVILFCPNCYEEVTPKNKLRGVMVVDDTKTRTICLNCNSENTAVPLPLGTVKLIHGKFERACKDIRSLRRALSKHVRFEGRSARELGSGLWRVAQLKNDADVCTVDVEANSESEALDKALELLPWVEHPRSWDEVHRGRPA